MEVRIMWKCMLCYSNISWTFGFYCQSDLLSSQSTVKQNNLTAYQWI